MIYESEDDILKVENPSVIIHQVNCLGYCSTGLMKRIADQYPSLFNEYHSLCGWFKDYKHQHEMLGTIQALPFPNSNNILCNAFSQKFFTDTRYEVDLDAWDLIMRKVIAQTNAKYKRDHVLYEFHCPMKIGVGMKQHEIDNLKDIVEEHFANNPIKWFYHI